MKDTGSTLTREDRAFLTFIAQLAVAEVLREAKMEAARRLRTAPCGGTEPEPGSGDDGSA